MSTSRHEAALAAPGDVQQGNGTGTVATASSAPASRKRRWATRARTGCLTCRARHVKCDEARPVCRRCQVGHHGCRGYDLPPPGDTNAGWDLSASGPLPAHAIRPYDSGATLRGQRPGVTKEAEPPSWDYMQAVRYYFECLKPICAKEYGEVVDPPFNSTAVVPLFFTCNVIGSRMAIEYKRQHGLVHLANRTENSALRANYARYSLELIRIANLLIEGGSYWGAKRVFGALLSLLLLDLTARESMWQAHIKGCFVYVRNVFGGVQTVVAWPFPIFPFSRLLFKAIIFDTTTPAGRQVLEYTTYTDEQLKTLLGYEFDENTPCSTDARVFIVHVTRLRDHAFAYKGHVSVKKQASKTQELLSKINGFDISSWVQENSVFGVELTLQVERIFQLAVQLYGILTLPRPAVIAWARSMAYPKLPEHNTYDSVRMTQGTELVVLLRQAFPLLDFKPGIRWPIVVAGVAVAGGSFDDQKFVDQSLFEIWKHPLSEHGPLICLQKLRRLWSSGKTGWEDCFDEPVPC
ncbi:hypothetical protein NLG97_g3777 [Lecanicillium saksenae]|uniref:Uncharacterized protein n=1 Tax=Lecanicillium saksenae TaxID=468837 RepID=A0ACC1QZT4_9HYPO|nr:hypothetical protein NLG97_g3777 [Lecanicillium saksenae]